MTKDPLIFSGLAGAIGNITKEVMIWSLYFTGALKYTFIHFCAGMVVNPATYVKEPLSLVVGIMIDYTIAAVFGVGMYGAMRKTGTDHWVLKGLGFGMIVFLICYGILRPTFSIKIESSPFTVLMYMVSNWIYAVTTCWFLKRYGTYSPLSGK